MTSTLTSTSTVTVRSVVRWFLILAFVALLGVAFIPIHAAAQESSPSTAQAAPTDHGPDAELAKEAREGVGEEEENENLKHSASVQWFSRKTGMTVHQVHLLMFVANFLIIAFLIYWFARKSVPAALRNRTESIQRALEEGRAASADANRRLADIEARLSKLDSEIASMQAQSEKEAEAEEARIKQAAEDDIRKVVRAAEQEIASAAKQARRDLTTHTADLAVALARKQIQVDAATDQLLVRNFSGKLSSGSGGKDRQ
jgi:F-type H+-transporting ATPase subunit b